MSAPSLSRATRSIVTASPSAAARSTSVVTAKRSRRASICSSTSASVTSADVELGGDLDVLAVGELREVDLGLAERLDLRLLEGLAVPARQGAVDGLVEDGAAADALVHDGGRDLALAEAGDLDLGPDRLVGLVEARLELLERHLDGELDPRGAQGLGGALHVVLLLRWWWSGCVPQPLGTCRGRGRSRGLTSLQQDLGPVSHAAPDGGEPRFMRTPSSRAHRGLIADR
jgi:hypothetical protein